MAICEKCKQYEKEIQGCIYMDASCKNGEMFEPLTNYGRIKDMSVDEMAELLYGIIHERDLFLLEKLKDNGIDASLIEMQPELHIAYHKKWLESEVNE